MLIESFGVFHCQMQSHNLSYEAIQHASTLCSCATLVESSDFASRFLNCPDLELCVFLSEEERREMNSGV